ncbi:unnamed protein product [Effrenium voratum]|nr:unnamed protein product [Effrenium voratum]
MKPAQGPFGFLGESLAKPKVATMLVAAHAFAETTRLAASWIGAVTTGTFFWIPTLLITLLLNLFLRLGWSRWCLFQLLKRLRLRRLARKVAPVDWNLIHDEVRIYGGYFRFVPILALVVARAFVYGLLPATSPRFALFNASAGWALLVMLIAELMEDLVVVQESSCHTRPWRRSGTSGTRRGSASTSQASWWRLR